jgi:uncharacterized protein (DUF1501 family)
MISRRDILRSGALGVGTFILSPGITLATVPTERRFVFIIQRGAADGLNIVIPYADPAYAKLRGALAVDPASATRLDGMFALHPALAETAKMYGRKEALFVHAVASPYRERSHFDGQNVLETGGTQPYQMKDGWLNRLVAAMPHAKDEAIAIAATVPMALRGPVPVTSYAPSALPEPPDDLLSRVGQLYTQDPQLHALWSAALEAKGLAADTGAKQDPASLGKLAASFLTKPNGPRIAMLETGGWDTHSGQEGRLSAQLKALDTLLASLRDSLGPAWAQTTVLVATEFGRTAAVNGTGGTDHGTGAVAWLLGGAVKGGRVIADWPGLASGQLYEERDLRPTMPLDNLIAGVAAEALALDPGHLGRTLFAGSASGKPLTGLITA